MVPFVLPVGPLVIVVSGGLVSIVKVLLAGLGSTLKALSVALTSKLWGPSLSAAVVNGEMQLENAAPSIRHSNVAPNSFDENENVGVSSFVVPVGPAVMIVSGGSVSGGGSGGGVSPVVPVSPAVMIVPGGSVFAVPGARDMNTPIAAIASASRRARAPPDVRPWGARCGRGPRLKVLDIRIPGRADGSFCR